ncbi:MAG: hypothetical protein KGS44_15075 [Alphaproteobacteria bacterium]|nr:hypothetical protein [Alphaproteobacteria bacterium]
MRMILVAAAMGLSFLGVAVASEFVVVRSTDPAVARSTTFKAGDRVMVAPGATLTLMGPDGDVLTLRGDAAGRLTVPATETRRSDFLRLSALREMLTRPSDRRAFGAVRSDEDACPLAETLTSFDLILEADEAGCTQEATVALDLFVNARLAADEEPKPDAVAAPSAVAEGKATP